MDDKFFDLYFQDGDQPVFCYRSGLMVYEEQFYKGTLLSRGYNAAGYPLNVLSNCPSRLNHMAFDEPFAFNLEVNGVSLDRGLEYVGLDTERDGSSLHSAVTLKSTLLPIMIKVHTVLDGTQMFTRYLEIENLSDAPVNVSRISLLSGGVESMERAPLTYSNDVEKFYSVGYFDEDEWGREGDFAWHDLDPDVHCIDFCFNRERFRHPVMFIRNNVMGTMFFSQIGWSGGSRYTVDYNAKKEKAWSHLSLKAEITGYNPLIILQPHESFVTPEVYMGVIQGGLDEAVNEMHAHVRRSVLNLPEADPSACLIGCGMGAEHDMSVETSKAFIDQFADMGGEIFIIDAGWQCPPGKEMSWPAFNGRYKPDAERYKNGLCEVSDYCHEKGLKFAMWTEIERLGEHSDVFKEHPEWRADNVFGEKVPFFLNMANPECAAWAEETLASFIVENKLDLLRVDHNVEHFYYFTFTDGACSPLRHFTAAHKMYQNLKKRFPNVIFENCASGGGRTNLGILKGFTHTWVSDWQKAPRSILITNGMTMALPPERVDRLFAGMGCHSFGSFDLHMRNAMLSHMSLNVVAPATAKLNSDQMAFVKHSTDIYKSFIRPFLPTCLVFHHTPEAKVAMEEGFCAIEIAANDRSRGALGFFSLTGRAEQTRRIVLKGADAGSRYRVTLDNTGMTFEASGAELLQNGVSITVPASLSSELVLFEKI